MPPRTPWTHWPNLKIVQMPHSTSSAGFTDLRLQWRQPFEVLPKIQMPNVEKDKADRMLSSAAAHIMDDDLESAEAGLANGNSAFHKVCGTLLLSCLG